jgi:hypothetical protein
MEGKMNKTSREIRLGMLGLAPDATKAIGELAEKYGLEVSMTNQKSSPNGWGCWFQFTIPESREEKEERQRLSFMSNVHARVCRGRVKAEDFGRVFSHKGLRYRIVGINRDADKYPIQTEALDGGPDYRFPLAVSHPNEIEKLVYHG